MRGFPAFDADRRQGVNRRCRCADGKSSRRGGCGYPGPGTTRHAVHFTGECDFVRPDARGGVWTTGFPTTKKAVGWNGERRRPIARETCLVRTFRASREIRNAAHSNGVRGSSTGPHPHHGVDILPQASLESLCISMVSVGDRSDRASARAPVSDRRTAASRVAHSNRTRDRAFRSSVCRDVDIRSPEPVDVLCISAVRAGACCSAASV